MHRVVRESLGSPVLRTSAVSPASRRSVRRQAGSRHVPPYESATGEPTTVLALGLSRGHIAGAVVAGDQALLSTRWPVAPTLDTDEVVDLLLDYTVHLVKLAERLGRRPAAGCVVLAEDDNSTHFASIVRESYWRGVPVRAWLEEHLDLPVTTGNEVCAGALAEALLGAGRGSDAFLYVPVADRVPAVVVLDGHIRGGHRSVVGDLGGLHTWPTRAAGTGRTERVEHSASACAIARRYAAAGGEAGLTALSVYQRAMAGDGCAAQVWDEAVQAFADALASAVTVLSPDRVVIGGELAGADKAYFRRLRRAVAARLQERPAPVIVPAQLGFQAPLLGAALLTHRARAVAEPR